MTKRGEYAISVAEYLSSTETKRAIDFINLQTQQDQHRPQLEKNLHQVLHHGKYIMGAEIAELEQKLADYVGVKHCITVSSGTEALDIIGNHTVKCGLIKLFFISDNVFFLLMTTN